MAHGISPRTVAEGARTPPGRGAPAARRGPRGARLPAWLIEIGAMAHFSHLVGVRAVRRPYTWGGEFAAQFAFVIRICFFPLILSAFALSFGPVGVQASGFFGIVGAYDRMGAVYQLTVVRLFGPLVVGIVLAGAAGTAMCADLGARVVRDEIAALRVLGLDPIKRLVVPRVLAVLAAAVLFNVFAVISGMLGAMLVLVQNDADFGPFLSTFFANATALELQAATVKAGLYGAVIGIVACYKGMTVSGGAEGVGRAVNRSVVIAFLAIGFLDYVFTQLLLATHPILSELRG